MNFKLVILAFIIPSLSYGWGPVGHHAVAEIAQAHLTPKALKEIKVLLKRKNLAKISTWADQIKSSKKWKHTKPWHYVDVPNGKTYNQTTPSPKGNVVIAIEKFSKQVCLKTQTIKARMEALKFLTHFIADAHQPLHVGNGKDRGGNTVNLRWKGRKSNLHKVWDFEMLRLAKAKKSKIAKRLVEKYKNHPKQALWQKSTLLEWIQESATLRPRAYQYNPTRKNWEQSYTNKNIPFIEKRIFQAGLRLANTLNSCFK